MKHCRRRRAFVLLGVLVATMLVALLASGLQSAVWRATRNARRALAGERALHAATAALAAQVAAWNSRAFASMPIGTRQSTTVAWRHGVSATVTLVRTSIDGALLEAVASSTNDGAVGKAQRRVTQMLTLSYPPLGLQEPFTLLGSASFANAAPVSGADETPPGWKDDCVDADSIDAPTPPLNPVAARAAFDAGWARWTALASRTEHAPTVTELAPSLAGAQCAPGAGDPWRSGGSIGPCTNEWGARAMVGAGLIHLNANSRHQGVLMIDGDLNLTADLDVHGLLLVRGAVNASAGRLEVYGAALVRDINGTGSRFGSGTRVRYSGCALRRALSAIGAPAAITTRGWLERF